MNTSDTTRTHNALAAGGAVALSIALAAGYALPGYASAADSTPPSMPGGSTGGQPGSDGPGSSGGGQPGGNDPGNSGGGATGGGANTQTYDYTGSYSAVLKADGTKVDSEDKDYSTTDSDVNVALAQNSGTLTVSGGTLTKSGSDTDGDRCNFYGVNSIALAVNSGSKMILSGTTLSATSEGSNGIFATDSANAYANDVEITTTAGNSRGLDATYGGTIVANKASVSTKGDHSAAFATDRGGGNISVANSTATTAGSGSPLVYSTGCIEVDKLTGTASGSQIASMEGLNTIRIYNSQLTSTNTGTSGSDPVADGVIIYQSTSGDADTSTGSAARFEASDSTLASAIESGSMFYCTNTTANVVLSNTTLSFDTSKADLVRAEGNDANNWGSAGKNGATVSFTGIGQTLKGNAVADTISSLSMYLTEGTTWTGAAQIKTNSAGSTSTAPLTVNVDGSSTWIVTESCTVSALNAAKGAKIIDKSGKAVSIVADGKTVVAGDSSITVTVTGSYGTSVSTSSAQQLEGSSIDRTGFDAQFGTSTTFGTNAGGASGSETIAKTTQTITGGKTKVSCKSTNGKLKKAKSFRIGCTSSDGDAVLSYSLSSVYRKSGKKYVRLSSSKTGKIVKVAKTGKLTVKKGVRKGTYKVNVKVEASATNTSTAASTTKTIKVRVK